LKKIRKELKANEEKALNFVFPSIDSAEEEITRENFFSKTEKEQLLELWRATLARNRTIQFIIKSLSANPDDYEKNNAVMQLLARAMFVPFYAVTAIADNALVAGGSAVGARVIGDVVGDHTEKRDRSREITRTDMMVLFMLTDEVAERLRSAYYAYKEAKIEKELIKFELETARLDLAEAYDQEYDSSIFFTRMVVRDMERRTRENELNYRNNRRTLIELAGEEAVDSVGLLLDLEVEEILSNIIGV
jgi:vacuolar-type H+-ATPase subunit F/Vma7